MSGRMVVLYDGRCGLCASLVGFFKKRVDSQAVEWLPLEGERAAALLARLEGPRPGPDSMRVITDAGGAEERVFLRSGALVALAPLLPWPWRLLGLLRLVPRPLRDFLYRVVARMRPRSCAVGPSGP